MKGSRIPAIKGARGHPEILARRGEVSQRHCYSPDGHTRTLESWSREERSIKMRVASIDIGTNTILLLIARLEEGKVNPLFEMETVARLGEGVQRNGVLSQEAMDRGLETLSHYMDRCRSMGVEQVFAVGTSALREAENSHDFLDRVKEHLGLTIDIISGEEEALFSFLAVVRDLGESDKGPILVVDVGGGSTEFILGKGDRVCGWVSLPLGAVRFTEQFLFSDPVREEEWQRMEKAIREKLSQIPRAGEPIKMVAVGGTATTLASVEQGLNTFVVEKIHHFHLTREALRNQLHLYRSKTIEKRKNIPGLAPARADVIPAGGAILSMAMEELQCPSVLVSCHGVRYGVLYKRLNLLGSTTIHF
jgi:exopolyphosphatase/guanosine-5'-triphosphate,3'-diphosphate pyrophosphatase